MKKIILIILIVFNWQNIDAQNCLYTLNSDNFHQLLSQSENVNTYCINIQFYRIVRFDGSGGQTEEAINEAYELLNQVFNPHGISFNWDGNIITLQRKKIYNNPTLIEDDDPNVLEIYLTGDDANWYGNSYKKNFGGIAASAVYAGGQNFQFPGISNITTNRLAHEIGHILFLFHTNGLTTNENPDGSDCETTGDFVCDTSADPKINYNVDSNCVWNGNYQGSIDYPISSYNPPINNIMAYTYPTCMNHFTPGQGQRMRNALENVPCLQDLVTNECDDTTDECDDPCPEVFSAQIESTFDPINCSYLFDTSINDCYEDNFDFEYWWTLTKLFPNEVVATSELPEFNYQFTTNGTYRISLTVAYIINGSGQCYNGVVNQTFTISCGSESINNNNLRFTKNPIKQNQYIQFSGIDYNIINKIEVLDISGIIRKTYNSDSSSLNIGTLESGVYFVKFYTTKGIEQKKLIIK